MTKPLAGRAWPALDLVVFAVTLPLYAAAVPLGLGRVEAAASVAAGITVDPDPQGAPLALLAMRLIQYLPVGDVGFRANLTSAIFGALAMALLARLAVELVTPLRPPPSARQDARAFLAEPIAAGGAALAAALSLGTFAAATSAGFCTPTLVVLLAGLLAELVLLRDIGNKAAGLALSCLAGVAEGVEPTVALVLWPVLLALAIWALRKGARWPLWAPLGLLAALGGFALARAAASSVPPSARDLFVTPFTLIPRGRAALWSTATEIADQAGVVGVLLAAVGLFALAVRTPVVAAWLALNLVTCTLFASFAVVAEPEIASFLPALPMAIAVVFALACVGVWHVSSRLGRARVAAALTLTVILAFPSAMDGGRTRWLGRPLPMRLLDRALERAEVRGVVDPGTAEMAGVFRLARAIGLRPDLDIKAKSDR